MKKVFQLFSCALVCVMPLFFAGCTGICPTCREAIPARGVFTPAEQEATGFCCIAAKVKAEEAKMVAELIERESQGVAPATDESGSDAADPN